MLPNSVRLESALITGAASGIGAAFASKLAARKARLWLVDKDRDRLTGVTKALEAEHDIRVEAIHADLGESSGQDAVVDVIARQPDLDLLINNAGFSIPGIFRRMASERQVAMLQVHVIAPTRFCRAVLPAMVKRRSGAIINVCSMAQYVDSAGQYGASKIYLDAFSRNLAVEVGHLGIKVQALIPGYVATNFDSTDDFQQPRRNVIPGYLWSTPDTVAEASLRQLASAQVRCVPGAGNRVMEFMLRNGLYSRRLVRRWLV